MIDSKRVIDTMDPFEYRFRNHNVFFEFILPLTKYNELSYCQ
jgi:hypothetical protein